MSQRTGLQSPSRFALLLATTAAVFLVLQSQAHAQFVQQQVGGVAIDARGLVTKVQVDDLNELKRHREAAFKAVSGDLKDKSLRKVSLRQLEAAIAAFRKDGTPLSDEMRYLAGLQRIQYIFVYPEHNDIVLAGPGEGWKLNAQGEVVGLTTDKPVMLLDDLLVALRSIEMARTGGISCSIDPTAEGLKRFGALSKKLGPVGEDPSGVMKLMEEAMGPQTITVTGVPEVSHFARVLVAADYRMKRLAMGFDEPPIAGLPSFLQMMKSARSAGGPAMPRWWLAPDYDSLLTDAEGLAWELRGAGVKAMTEDERLGADGQRQRTGKASPLAQKWANTMTARYEELSAHDAVFGQLRNCIDLAIVAALISKENLTEKCGWSMPLLMDASLLTESYHAPHQVESLSTAAQKGSNWVITTSGGVLVNPWQPLEKPTSSPTLGAVRAKALVPGKNWWWN